MKHSFYSYLNLVSGRVCTFSGKRSYSTCLFFPKLALIRSHSYMLTLVFISSQFKGKKKKRRRFIEGQKSSYLTKHSHGLIVILFSELATVFRVKSIFVLHSSPPPPLPSPFSHPFSSRSPFSPLLFTSFLPFSSFPPPLLLLHLLFLFLSSEMVASLLI